MLEYNNQVWQMIKDGDPRGLQIFKRHYSYRESRKKQKLFVGPGEKLILLSVCEKALFVWRKFISDNGQTGVNCAVFRNESKHKSSHLILEAERIALMRWPNERLYTYVNSTKVTSSNPGYCFQMAGWKKIGFTKVNKLLIMSKP